MTGNFTLFLLNHIILIFITLVVLITFKGFIKTLVANLLGDDTAKNDGFLTLNPIAHIDFLSMSIALSVYFFISYIFSEISILDIPVLAIVIFCSKILIPAPIEDSNFKYPRAFGIITTLADIFSTFFLALVLTYCIKLFFIISMPNYAAISFIKILKSIISTAILWGLLDMIPIPPLGGGKILRYILSERMQPYLDWIENYSFIILFILFFAPIISDLFLGSIFLIKAYIQTFLFVNLLI